ncbi:MAG: hypothetical protein E6Q97_04580, partial [Desulfurellales bacterium]
MDDELVLCAETSQVWPDGGDRVQLRKLDSLFDLNQQFQSYFKRRGDVETDPTWQQLCSYLVIRCGREVMGYQRPNKGGDVRLQGAVSVGIGGHVNRTDARPDANVSQVILNGILRELDEETQIAAVASPPDLKGPVWLIRDPTNDVGRVHTGVVAVLDVEHPLEEFSVTGCVCSWSTPQQLFRHAEHIFGAGAVQRAVGCFQLSGRCKCLQRRDALRHIAPR